MKYKYLLISAYGLSDWECIRKLRDYLLSIDLSSLTITKETDKYGDDVLYVSFNSFEDLELLIKIIPEEMYEDIAGWQPHELVIDFRRKEIYLRDYYLE